MTMSSSSSSPASHPAVAVTVTESRLPSSPIASFFFILYFPLGCCLALVRFLLSFQIFLFTTLWPLPVGRLRNYLVRTMCSYLLGVWVKEEERPSAPSYASGISGRLRHRHHLNKPFTAAKTSTTNEDDQEGDEKREEEKKNGSRTVPPPPPPNCSSVSAGEEDDDRMKLLVANARTPIDGAVIGLITDKTRVLNTTKLNPLLSWVFGYKTIRGGRGGGADGNSTRTPLEQTIEEEAKAGTERVLVFPELSATNGKGVLKFEEALICCKSVKLDGVIRNEAIPLQPVVVRFRRYPVDFPFATLESSTLADLFWLLWCPVNLFTVETLDVVRMQEGESPQAISTRVQSVIAASLQVPPLSDGHLDRHEYVKRRLKDLQHGDDANAAASGQMPSQRRRLRTDTQMASRDAAIEIMVEQVKTVLPQVPTAVIRKDVRLTKDVDLSITRFLEGVVAYVAEEEQRPSTPTSGSRGNENRHPQGVSEEASTFSSDSSNVDSLIASSSIDSNATAEAAAPAKSEPRTSTLAAKTFPKSSQLRQMSFAERKKLMIEQSRERYFKRIANKS